MKRIYSVALSEEVMRLVDERAARDGVSRSEEVERLLAQGVEHETPRMSMRSLWDALAAYVGEGDLKFGPFASPKTAWAEGTLEYPYRPTVRYTVELAPGAPYLGQLRVGLRARSAALWQRLEDFFADWAALEEHYQGKSLWTREGERFCRLLLRVSWQRERQGEELYAYLNGLNRGLNLYFSQGADAAAHHYEQTMTRLSI